MAIIASLSNRLSLSGKSTASLCFKRKEGKAGIEGLSKMTELCIISDATHLFVGAKAAIGR